MAQGKGKGKGVSGAGSTSSGGSTGGGGSSSSGGSSSGGGSTGGGGSSSSGGSSGGSSSSGGSRASRFTPTPATAPVVSGSSSTTTPPNAQSTVAVSAPNYSQALGYSTNALTQGAGSASKIHSPEVSQSQQTTGQANVTTLGVKPDVNITSQVGGQFAMLPNEVSYQGGSIDPDSYAYLVDQYGAETAQKLAEQTYMTQQEFKTKFPATNTDNQYLQSENAALTNAEKRQQEFVNNNSFMANPQPMATAPIPNVITVSTPLYQQAGEKENPLTILEGNKFISPSQQYLPQINESIAVKPEYVAFTNNPYIGVHQNSDIAPNSDLSESQRKTWMDYLIDIKNHKYFPLAIVGIIALVVLSMFGGARVTKRGNGGKGVYRSIGGSGQPIITVVK